jgi:hypothetical protein
MGVPGRCRSHALLVDTFTDAISQTAIQDKTVQNAAQRVCELTTDVRILLRSLVCTVE